MPKCLAERHGGKESMITALATAKIDQSIYD
jgi:hypothetical protein